MTEVGRAEGDALYISAQEALNSAFAVIVEQIKAHPDPRSAYTEATELAGVLRHYITESADLRAMMATLIFEQEQLSLSGLASIVGVSKQRASQLVQAGRRARDAESPY